MERHCSGPWTNNNQRLSDSTWRNVHSEDSSPSFAPFRLPSLPPSSLVSTWDPIANLDARPANKRMMRVSVSSDNSIRLRCRWRWCGADRFDIETVSSPVAENAGHELVRCWNKISPRKEKKVREAKFSSVTARRDKYVNFYKRQGRGEEVYLKLQVLFQKMFEKRGWILSSESWKNGNKKKEEEEEGKGEGVYENDRFPRFGTNLKKEEEE